MVLKFLLKYWKNVLIGILIVVAFLSIKQCSNNSSSYQRIKTAQKVWEDSVTYYKDKNGQLVSQKQSAVLTTRELEEVIEDLRIDKGELIDKVGKLNRLNLYYKGQLESSGSGTITLTDTVIRVDTVYFDTKSFTWNNNYLKLKGLYYPKGDTIDFDYTYSTELELISYRKKKDVYVVDVRIMDDEAIITGQNSIVIDAGEKKWYQTDIFKFGMGILVGAAGKTALDK